MVHSYRGVVIRNRGVSVLNPHLQVFGVPLAKFDNDILIRYRPTPCMKSDAVGAVFQEADIFELNLSTSVRMVSSD